MACVITSAAPSKFLGGSISKYMSYSVDISFRSYRVLTQRTTGQCSLLAMRIYLVTPCPNWNWKLKKGTKSFDHSEFFFMHWTKLFPKNWTVLVSPSWDNAKSPPTATAQIGLFLYSDKEWYRPALKKDSPKKFNSLEIF